MPDPMTPNSQSTAALGVLISGRGSNLRAIADAVAAGEIPATIAIVVSNDAEAGGLALARDRGISTSVLRHRDFGTRADYDLAMVAELRRHNVTLVCLAGFMRLLGPDFWSAFPEAILNIHPSLLPSFPGTHAQRQALEHGVKVSGATVHFVTPALDAGPIVAQAVVPVEDDDTEDTLSARILEAEHRLYPRAIRDVIHGDWQIGGRRVVFQRPSRRV
jgi:phosphoribosylglycinamide formyltransferase-1